MTESLPRTQARSMRVGDLVLVLALGLFTNCYLLGQGPLAGTEGHRALAAHDMVTTGRWVIPHLYDQVYLRKPPLQYWIAAGLETLTGRAEPLIWRMPSAIFGALTSVFLYWITARWFRRLAGLVSGVGCCGLLTLWGQNRTAEIDALNTFGCIICTCALLDLGWNRRSGKWAMTFVAALGFAIAMLTKGPAGMAPIAGALIGPWLFNKDKRALTSSGPWIAIILGLVPFLIYGALAYSSFRAQKSAPDTQGIKEIYINLVTNRVQDIVDSIELTPLLFAYSQPISLMALFALHPAVWKKNANGEWCSDDGNLVRGIAGTMVVALIITLIFGLVKPRYSYVWLPMFCPMAGAAAAAWQRGIFPGEIGKRRTLESAGYAVILFALGQIGFAYWDFRRHAPFWPIALAGAIAVIPIAIGAIIALKRSRFALAGWGFVLLIALISLAYGPWGILDREKRSTTVASAELDHLFPKGTTLTTGDLIFEQPEMFYYAGMNVESYPIGMSEPMDFPTSRWLLMEPEEYAAWQKLAPGKLQHARNINKSGPENPTIILAWYEK